MTRIADIWRYRQDNDYGGDPDIWDVTSGFPRARAQLEQLQMLADSLEVAPVAIVSGSGLTLKPESQDDADLLPCLLGQRVKLALVNAHD